jgi:hypothetical protein
LRVGVFPQVYPSESAPVLGVRLTVFEAARVCAGSLPPALRESDQNETG